MTTLIVILALVAIIVVAVVALAIGFTNGCEDGYAAGMNESAEVQYKAGYQNGYLDAIADFNEALVNRN